MAREQAVSTMSPFRMVLGAPVMNEDAVEVIKQLNWSYGFRPQLHCAQTTAAADWEASGSPHTHGIAFRAAGSAHEVFRFRVKLLPETIEVTCGAECDFVAGGVGVEDGDVTFSFRDDSDTLLDSVTLSFSVDDDGDEKKDEVQIASTGSGWVTVTIEIEKQNGAGAASLFRFRVQDKEIDAADVTLPAPLLEGDNDTVDIQEEGTTVLSSARKINFIGGTATAADAGSGVASITLTAGGGGVYTKTAVTTATYTVLAEQEILHVTRTSSGTCTINLRAAATAGDGAWLKIVDAGGNASANNITIDGSGSETINGSTTYVLSADYAAAEIYTDGSNWFVAP